MKEVRISHSVIWRLVNPTLWNRIHFPSQIRLQYADPGGKNLRKKQKNARKLIVFVILLNKLSKFGPAPCFLKNFSAPLICLFQLQKKFHKLIDWLHIFLKLAPDTHWEKQLDPDPQKMRIHSHCHPRFSFWGYTLGFSFRFVICRLFSWGWTLGFSFRGFILRLNSWVFLHGGHLEVFFCRLKSWVFPHGFHLEVFLCSLNYWVFL